MNACIVLNLSEFENTVSDISMKQSFNKLFDNNELFIWKNCNFGVRIGSFLITNW